MVSDVRAFEILELTPAATPADREAAYRRRLRETDPARVRDMDPEIRRVTARRRDQVELAYALLLERRGPSPAERALLEGREAPDAPPPGPPAKSYWRAAMLTAAFPGAGSWYGGGRRRGLVAMAAFVALILFVIRELRAASAAAGSTPMAGIMAAAGRWAELRGLAYGGLGLLLVDALLSTWAHNDRLGSGEAPGGAGPDAGG